MQMWANAPVALLAATLGGRIPSSTPILCEKAHVEICQNLQVVRYPELGSTANPSERRSLAGEEGGQAQGWRPAPLLCSTPTPNMAPTLERSKVNALIR